MLYLKSYCYSQHELAFVIANLIEGWDYIEKLCLYEYNYTHTGCEKKYEDSKINPDIQKIKIDRLIGIIDIENPYPHFESAKYECEVKKKTLF